MANTLPKDSNNVLYEGLYDPAGTQFVAKQAGTVSTAGGVNYAAETMTNDGTFAKETGGNVAALATATGSQSDAAYAGGNGSSIAIEKGIFTKVTTLATNSPVLGQSTMSASIPVTMASNQSNVPVSGAAAAFVDGAIATIGALADAAWTSGSGSVIAVLKAIAGKIPGLGSAVSASSLPVVIASDQAAVATTIAPATTGGTTHYHFISTATNVGNALNVKASAGQLYGYELGNNGAADAYVKLYNSASAPTTGSGTPVRTIYLPKGTSKSVQTSLGIPFSTGIGHTITGLMPDSDATAVAVSQVSIELDYK